MVSLELHGRGSVSEGYVSEAKMTNVIKIARTRDPPIFSLCDKYRILELMFCSEREAECTRWFLTDGKDF